VHAVAAVHLTQVAVGHVIHDGVKAPGTEQHAGGLPATARYAAPSAGRGTAGGCIQRGGRHDGPCAYVGRQVILYGADS
jgi:hypothetical protein